MFVRRRPLLRAAVIGGGAYAAGRHRASRSAEQAQSEEEQNERLADLEQQPGQPAAALSAGPSLLDQLNQLDGLHQQGALTDSEFTVAKGKLLGT